MKVKEVPQDEKFFKNNNVRDICYALDENGDYQQVISVGWEPKNEALSLTWENIAEEAEDVRKEVLDGTKSPLAYHMEIGLLDVNLLSAYSGVSKKEIKKHLQPEEFNKLEESVLKKYADALSITVKELKTV